MCVCSRQPADNLSDADRLSAGCTRLPQLAVRLGQAGLLFYGRVHSGVFWVGRQSPTLNTSINCLCLSSINRFSTTHLPFLIITVFSGWADNLLPSTHQSTASVLHPATVSPPHTCLSSSLRCFLGGRTISYPQYINQLPLSFIHQPFLHHTLAFPHHYGVFWVDGQSPTLNTSINCLCPSSINRFSTTHLPFLIIQQSFPSIHVVSGSVQAEPGDIMNETNGSMYIYICVCVPGGDVRLL